MNKKWVLSKDTTGEGEPIIKLPNGLWAATTCIDASSSGERITAGDARKNAELIVAMQNLCVTLNPDNPLAAANALADAAAALEAIEEADKAWAACQKCSKLPPEGLCYACYKKFEAVGAMRKSALARLKGGEQ